MRRKQALSLAAAAVVAAGVFAGAWPAFADEVPPPPSTPTTAPSYPEPPHKPEPTGPYTPPSNPTADPSVTPPPWPSFPPDEDF